MCVYVCFFELVIFFSFHSKNWFFRKFPIRKDVLACTSTKNISQPYIAIVRISPFIKSACSTSTYTSSLTFLSFPKVILGAVSRWQYTYFTTLRVLVTIISYMSYYRNYRIILKYFISAVNRDTRMLRA